VLTTRRCGVLGSPIAHSLSPVMHRAAYEWLGLDWSYDPYEVDEAGLPGFLAGLDASWRGLSLTMPLKREVIGMLDEATETVREVGAANTVLLADGRMVGDNTDVPGIVAALAERGVTRVRSAIVIGGGATAESFVAALRRIGLGSVRIVVRDPARVEELVRRASSHGVDIAVSPWENGDIEVEGEGEVDLLASTVPASAVGVVADRLVSRAAAVFDAIYDPWPTPLAERAAAAGRVVVSGVDLLAHQAVPQVELMTGRAVPVEVVREAALAELA
jgi:shikimate dehydrogenase